MLVKGTQSMDDEHAIVCIERVGEVQSIFYESFNLTSLMLPLNLSCRTKYLIFLDRVFPKIICSVLASQWRHNGLDGVSNHQRLYCLLNLLSRHRQIKHQTPRHWPLWGEITGHRRIPRTGLVTRNMFPSDDVIMLSLAWKFRYHHITYM